MTNSQNLKSIGLKATFPRLKILDLFQTTDAANPVSTAICARVGCRPVDETVGYDFVAP